MSQIHSAQGETGKKEQISKQTVSTGKLLEITDHRNTNYNTEIPPHRP